ncbi:MAG: VWA domain-containing protein [Planctomycetaceae bacterium]|nr:VWA domain-containing protein [Planctomycetaceae bacterium]
MPFVHSLHPEIFRQLSIIQAPDSIAEPIAAAPGVEVETQSFRTTELDLPESTAGILLLLGSIAVLAGLTVRTALKDSRFLKARARAILLIPRLLLLALVLMIVLNPQQRTQLSRVEKSRVSILLDTSLSMAWSAADPVNDGTQVENQEIDISRSPGTSETRADMAVKSLISSGVLSELSRKHTVSIYTFDSAMTGPWAIVSEDHVRFVDVDPSMQTGQTDTEESQNDQTPAPVSAATVTLAETATSTGAITDPAALKQWRSLIQPRGAETRIGESLYQLIGQISGRTLSGVVLISDGRSNSGLNMEPARVRAERTGTRLITVGVGSQKPQLNLWVAGMQSPADVHQGDPFDITVMLQGTASHAEQATVRLFEQSSDGDGQDRRQVAEQTIQLADDSIPTTVRFSQELKVPGKYEFTALIESTAGSIEMTLDDNERRRTIEVTDRKMKVLVISSGPMRDYQFVRNTLFRHSGVDSDVWLQSVTDENVGFVSQEAKKLLTKFPTTEAELFEYDVIVAFDPDWSRLSSEQQVFLNRWVSEHAGGFVVVAGEIFTPVLAQEPETFRDITVLYPVLLNRMPPELQLSQRADEPWPITLTPEGRATEFLKIADETGNASVDLWQTFKGIYRSYPVRGVRDGAVVLLEYGNPRARTELGQPPFLAAQIYGTGRTIFIGSAETWRLREISPQAHQRFWTSLIREVGQGRRSRGNARGILMLDRTEVAPGQLVTVRAQVYDARLQPLSTESVPLTVTDGEGRTLTLPDRLNSDSRGAGLYTAGFRPPGPGIYRLSVPVPESSDVLQASIDVVLPNLESQNPTQDVELLTTLTRDTQGRYLAITDLATLPTLLPDQSQPVVVDEQLRTLWDRRWLMFFMVTLLGFEWIMRRLWRLS